jgi:hypothetical protein
VRRGDAVRWFIDEAYGADDAAWDAMLAAYTAHVAEIAPALPSDLRALATDPRLNLHDARFISVVLDREAETVEMLLALDDDRALRLVFGGAAFVEDDLQAIAYGVGATFGAAHWGSVRTVIRAQEVELAEDGRFLLRLRLWPFHEFGLTFSSFSLVEVPAPPDDGQPGAFSFANEEADD